MGLKITQNRRGATHLQNWGVESPPEPAVVDQTGKQNPDGEPVDTMAMRRAFDCCGRLEYPRVDHIDGGKGCG